MLILPLLVLGNKKAALSLEVLAARGITHVLNMAQGEGAYRVETDASFYAHAGKRDKGDAEGENQWEE